MLIDRREVLHVILDRVKHVTAIHLVPENALQGQIVWIELSRRGRRRFVDPTEPAGWQATQLIPHCEVWAVDIVLEAPGFHPALR